MNPYCCAQWFCEVVLSTLMCKIVGREAVSLTTGIAYLAAQASNHVGNSF